MKVIDLDVIKITTSRSPVEGAVWYPVIIRVN